MNTEIKLQYQLSNGNWVNCRKSGSDDRTEEFLVLCEKNNGINATGKIVPIRLALHPLTRDNVIMALLAGQKLRNAPDDWYSNCRSEIPVIEQRNLREAAQARIEYVRCDCGHSAPRGSVMSASLGSSCPDCYDRLSS
jgi:hypothetical protein